ncbi:MAG: hypothetical protein U1F06_02050 [Steroidobacteraceae bacterium]
MLLLMQRRQLRGLEALSRQLQNIAIGGSLRSRIELHTDQPQLGAIVTAINHVLERAAPLAEPAATAATARSRRRSPCSATASMTWC